MWMNLFKFVWSQAKPFPLKEILITLGAWLKSALAFHVFLTIEKLMFKEIILVGISSIST